VAVVSLLCGLLSLFLIGANSVGILGGMPITASVVCGLTGIVLGHVARSRRGAPDKSDAKFFTAGLVLSYAALGAALSLALLALSHQPSQLFPPGN
jgi:hypothetical protein